MDFTCKTREECNFSEKRVKWKFFFEVQVENLKFFKYRMTKRTLLLESSREI